MMHRAEQININPKRMCPMCGYDVASLLLLGIGVCPECGGTISEELCRPKEKGQGGFVRFLGPVLLGASIVVCAASLMGMMFRNQWVRVGAGVAMFVFVWASLRDATVRARELRVVKPSAGILSSRAVTATEICISLFVIVLVIVSVVRKLI